MKPRTTNGEWWDYDWVVAPGCTKVSAECAHCWALMMAARLQGMRKPGYAGLVDDHGRWTGRVIPLEERLAVPGALKRSRVIAVNLMGDLFHPQVTQQFQKRVFDVMALHCQHTYLVLTKRPELCAEFLKWSNLYPMGHVLIGVTAGTQKTANQHWSAMAWIAQRGWQTWVSAEPQLEMIDWHGWAFLKWMVAGGESGPYARPSAPAWFRADRDWCVSHNIPFWFKQWGEWGPELPGLDLSDYRMTRLGNEMIFRYGRTLAGRTLDGRTWEEFPE